MADGFAVRWVVVQNDLPAITARMLPLVEAIVAKTALDVEADAKTRAPVDTGTLRNSIQATKVGAAYWRVTVGADYGVHVEWGTRFMGARPFLRPALTSITPTFREAMRQVVTL